MEEGDVFDGRKNFHHWNGMQPSWHDDEKNLFVSMAVFVLQELPTLDLFFKSLQRVLRVGERFHAIVTHPDYADHLLRRGQAFLEGAGSSVTQDFRYMLRYPVPCGDRVMYLPHFQRRFEDYEHSAAKHGFCLRSELTHELTVPTTPETKRVFGATTYGRDILKRPSSLLLVFEREEKA